MLSIIQLIALFVVIINIVLTIYLLIDRPHILQKLVFSFITLQIACWGFIHLYASLVINTELIIVLDQASLVSVLFIPSTLLFFVSILPSRRAISKWISILLFIPPLAMLPFSLGVFSAVGSTSTNAAYGQIIGTPLYNVFIPYFLIYVGIALLLLFFQIRNEKSLIKRQQKKYVMWGIAISGVIGIVNNAILFEWMNIYMDPLYGVVGTLFFSTSITYAITRYRFFRSVSLITQSLIFLILGGFIYLLVSLLFVMNQVLDQDAVILLKLVFTGVLLITLLLLTKKNRFIRPDKKRILPKNDYNFFHATKPKKRIDKYEYFKILSHDIQYHLQKEFNRIDTSVYFLVYPEKEWITLNNSNKLSLQLDHIYPKALNIQKKIILKQEIMIDQYKYENNIFSDEWLDELLRHMEKDQLDVLIPLFNQSKSLRAIITASIMNDKEMITIEKIKRFEELAVEFNKWLTAVLTYYGAVRKIC
ncbi:MAG: histidine kinase N-terminal 7TM domain-containing protein [Candidatus Kerfeldbacteria bacterium]